MIQRAFTNVGLEMQEMQMILLSGIKVVFHKPFVFHRLSLIFSINETNQTEQKAMLLRLNTLVIISVLYKPVDRICSIVSQMFAVLSCAKNVEPLLPFPLLGAPITFPSLQIKYITCAKNIKTRSQFYLKKSEQCCLLIFPISTLSCETNCVIDDPLWMIAIPNKTFSSYYYHLTFKSFIYQDFISPYLTRLINNQKSGNYQIILSFSAALKCRSSAILSISSNVPSWHTTVFTLNYSLLIISLCSRLMIHVLFY